MAAPLSLALVQTAAVPAGDLTPYVRQVEELARQRPSVRLVVHPELHLCGPPWSDGSDPRPGPDELAEPIDGPRDRELAALAGDLGLWLAPGSVYERGEDGRTYNTMAVYSPQGRRVGSYRKVFPWRPYETCAPGSEFVVVDLGEHGRVGLSICYDVWFPEAARHLAWMGADLVLNIVQTPTVDREQELVLVRATAITNQVFVASLNGAGPTALGRSLVVDPEGRVRARTVGAEDTVVTDVLDLGEAQRVRDYGTAGLNRLWQQLEPQDTPIDLPLYGGKLDPATWGAGRGAVVEDLAD